LIFLGVWRRIRQCGRRKKSDEGTDVVGLFLALLGTTTQTEHQVEGGLLLNVVVAEGAAVLELLAGEDQALLVGRDPCKVSG
jgi:hypothetical protein